MTLNELRYAVAVARERHFGRAAEACFVSQPTLSVAIRKLEEELGVVLFERVRNAVRLTPTGEKVVEQAQQVLEQIESILTTRRFTPPIPSRRIALAWRKGFPRTKAIDTLAQAIEQASSTCAVVATN